MIGSNSINSKIIFRIGFFWISLGTFYIFSLIDNIVFESYFALSVKQTIFAFVSLSSIIIGTFFIFKKNWAYNAMVYQSSILISGIFLLCAKMVIFGIFDIVSFQTFGSCLRLIFGLVIGLSSAPFILIVLNLKTGKLKNYYASK